VHVRAQEKPLPAAKMAGTSYQNNSLVELSDLDAEPSFVLAAHVCRDNARSDFLIEIAIRPFDAHRPGGGAGANESSSGKSVQIESQPVLQAGTLTWARHSIVPLPLCCQPIQHAAAV
jgi:hypothetical protein